MVVIAVGDENEVDRWENVKSNARPLQSRDEQRDGIRIHGIGDEMDFTHLEQYRCMVDEGDRAGHWSKGGA
jgi:hypothetical protein